MGSLGNPKVWVPYVNNKDCSQGFCSLHCPQWCYIVFPPPPPLVFPDDYSGPKFSPLVIAIIGILASAFLLVSYYAIISKFCGNRNPTRRENQETNLELEEYHDPSNHEPWHVANNGLDEALIKNITLLKYKKGDGLIDGTDCSVCLTEFHEDESLRLLPKCSHAFHVVCIDTWLRSHSNCPLCRANIVFTNASPLPLPPPDSGSSTDNQTASQNHQENNNLDLQGDTERGAAGETLQGDIVPKPPVRAFSDLGNFKCDTILEIREDEEGQKIRRSVSMDFASQGHLSIVDILNITEEEDFQIVEFHSQGDVGSSKLPTRRMSKPSQRNRVLLCATSSVAMKRSFSSGRVSFTKCGRGRNSIIPL